MYHSQVNTYTLFCISFSENDTQAAQFGMKYFYYDPEYVEQVKLKDLNPTKIVDKKQTSLVVVNGEHLAKAVKALLRLKEDVCGFPFSNKMTFV